VLEPLLGIDLAGDEGPGDGVRILPFAPFSWVNVNMLGHCFCVPARMLIKQYSALAVTESQQGAPQIGIADGIAVDLARCIASYVVSQAYRVS